VIPIGRIRCCRGVATYITLRRQDGDNESQVQAIENLISAGAKGFLITANDSKAIVPSLDKAKQGGCSSSPWTPPSTPRRRQGRSVRRVGGVTGR